MKVRLKRKDKSNSKQTKTIYYAIIEKMEVPANATDDEIDDILVRLATNNGTLEEGKDYMWSENNLI